MGNTYKHLTASATATCIAELLTLPVCTVKTNYQNIENATIKETFKFIWKTNRIKGFYNASGWAISSQMISTASKYTLYRQIQGYVPNRFIAGGISGFFGSIMTHPFDVIKIHYQMQTSFLPELRKFGPSLLYRGYSKSLAKAVGGSMLFLPLYDIFNLYYRKNRYILACTDNPVVIAGLSGLSSSVISTTIMQPFDYMKTRQVMNNSYGRLICDFSEIKPYFKGLSLNLLRVVPHFVITMAVIKAIETHFYRAPGLARGYR